MGCGASPQVQDREKERDPVRQSTIAERARMAPLLVRMEKLSDLHREGLMSDSEFDHYRSALLAEIAGSPAPAMSAEKEARQRRAAEARKRVDEMAKQMRHTPDRLPEDYYTVLGSLPPKFTREVPEQDEWSHAGSGPMQEYYNSAAGNGIDGILADETTALDSHRNPVGTQYDLPRDGTMQEHTLVICWFSTEGSYGKPVSALKNKGFNVVVHVSRNSTVQQMMVSLLSADVVWLVSGKQISEPGFGEFLEALEAFHRRGGGIFIWGDNAPFFAHANLLLLRLFPGEGIALEGNDQGSQIMHAHVDGRSPGHLTKRHLIMTGLNALFEGVTISYLPNVGPLKVLATYNNGSNNGVQYEGKAILCGCGRRGLPKMHGAIQDRSRPISDRWRLHQALRRVLVQDSRDR